MTRVRGPIGKGKAIATVDGEVACEAEITFAIGDKRNKRYKSLLVKNTGDFLFPLYIDGNIKMQINQKTSCK